MSDTITVENMTIENAREKLGSWLIGAAVLSRHRAMGDAVKRYDDLCSKAYKLLGNDEYKRIYDKTVKEVCG